MRSSASILESSIISGASELGREVVPVISERPSAASARSTTHAQAVVTRTTLPSSRAGLFAPYYFKPHLSRPSTSTSTSTAISTLALPADEIDALSSLCLDTRAYEADPHLPPCRRLQPSLSCLCSSWPSWVRLAAFPLSHLANDPGYPELPMPWPSPHQCSSPWTLRSLPRLATMPGPLNRRPLPVHEKAEPPSRAAAVCSGPNGAQEEPRTQNAVVL